MRHLQPGTPGNRPYIPAIDLHLERSTFSRALPTGAASHCSHYIFEATRRRSLNRLQLAFDTLKILIVLAFIVMTWSFCFAQDSSSLGAGLPSSLSESARSSSGAAASALTSEPSKGLAAGLVNQTLATAPDGGHVDSSEQDYCYVRSHVIGGIARGMSPHPPVSVASRTPPAADPSLIHGVVSADVSLSMGPDYLAHVFLVQGNASYAGQPLSNAKIIVRLNSSEDSQNIETTTQDDGSFSLMIALGSTLNEAIDWSIEGRDDAHRPAHVEGRQIILANDGSITTLSQQLEFHVPQGRPASFDSKAEDASI